VLERHLAALLETMPRATSFSVRAREAIAADLSSAVPSAAAVARKLHTSRRTMQRLLAAEGTTFTRLVKMIGGMNGSDIGALRHPKRNSERRFLSDIPHDGVETGEAVRLHAALEELAKLALDEGLST
jgi:AraC-like DNA-binding protein